MEYSVFYYYVPTLRSVSQSIVSGNRMIYYYGKNVRTRIYNQIVVVVEYLYKHPEKFLQMNKAINTRQKKILDGIKALYYLFCIYLWTWWY